MQFLSFGGGSSLAKSFSDSFHRANVSNLGPNWVYMSQPNALTQVHTTSYSVSGNAWTCQDSSVNQTENNSPECWCPFPILNKAVAGKTQFSQARFLSSTAAAGHDMRAGIVAGCGITSTGDFECYLFWVETGPVYRLFKYSANAFADLAGGGFGAPAANDVMRLSMVVGSGSNTIIAAVNGTAAKTVVDASPIVTGWPGMTRSIWISGAAPPLTTFTFDNFSCGIGA